VFLPLHVNAENLGILLSALGLASMPLVLPAVDAGACWGSRPLDGLLTLLVFIPVAVAVAAVHWDLRAAAAAVATRACATARVRDVLSARFSALQKVPHLALGGGHTAGNLRAWGQLRAFARRHYNAEAAGCSGGGTGAGGGGGVDGSGGNMGAGGTAAGLTAGAHVLALALFALCTLAVTARIPAAYAAYFVLVTGVYLHASGGMLGALLATEESRRAHGVALRGEAYAATLQAAAARAATAQEGGEVGGGAVAAGEECVGKVREDEEPSGGEEDRAAATAAVTAAACERWRREDTLRGAEAAAAVLTAAADYCAASEAASHTPAVIGIPLNVHTLFAARVNLHL